MKNLNRFFYGLIVISALSVTPGCSNEEQLSLDGTADARTPLAISVTNAGLTKVGGVVSGNKFTDPSSLGLFLTKEDGNSPYDEPYNNIQYTSSNSGQTWTASTPIQLTGTKANVYAYYPYNDSYNDITAIPINVSENKDVMWATPYSGAYNASPTATLPMNHALSVIRLSLSKGDYSGAGSIESITIKGDCMAKTGTLNAKTGDLTVGDAGTEIDLGATATLSTSAQTVEQLVIPTTTSGNISVTIQMDGKAFKTTSSASITPEKSKAYKFGLVFTDSQLTMSEVSIGEIAVVQGDDILPIVKTNPWADFTAENDGVYGIKADGSPMPYSQAKSTSETLEGVAIVIFGKAMQIANANEYSQWWPNNYQDIGVLKNYAKADNTNSYGYLMSGNTPLLSTNYKNWISSTGALSDFDGNNNTKKIISVIKIIMDAIGGTTNYTIAKKTEDFRISDKNQGYSDWYIPSAGQLAYMFLKRTEINTLLKKISGATQIPTTSKSYHWSSSEGDEAARAWEIAFDTGCLVKSHKDNNGSTHWVRYLRDLN